jgi:hypothetical protein
MTLRLVGAGVGRTGTKSLKEALELLLGAPCYHMMEVFSRPDDVPRWQEAVDTGSTDWDALFDGYAAAVDWPVGSFYKEVAARYPDAPVLLSTRPTDSWWKSAHDTIFNMGRLGDVPEMKAWYTMTTDLFRTRFTDDLENEAECKRQFERHNAEVRATVPADRLVEWSPGDGWEPICAALGVPVPDAPFPHTNTTAEFREMSGLPPV